jgi:hypothetical protein
MLKRIHPSNRVSDRLGSQVGRYAALAGLLLLGLALLAGCGSTTNAALSGAPNHGAAGGNTSSASSAVYGPDSPSAPSQATAQPTAQYLIKALNVGMAMPDTRATANALQSWIIATDPKAQSAGTSYSQDGSQYDVSMTFNVEASLYPQIKSYLTGYAGENKGKLIGLHETVQDVSNDYVDSQSRLANLRVEQARLQTLMGQAQSISDILTIEQRLTDVEGQIEQIEAHLNLLNGQTTFYSIQIQLTPLSTYVPPITEPWNPGVIFHSALTSAQAFGEGLLTLLIWLVVYAVYIIPLCVIIWLVVRFTRRRAARLATTTTGAAPPPAV